MFFNLIFHAVFIYGAIVMGCAFLFSRIGGTFLEKFITISGTVAGPILGLFTLGAFVPWANYKVLKITSFSRDISLDLVACLRVLFTLFFALQ